MVALQRFPGDGSTGEAPTRQPLTGQVNRPALLAFRKMTGHEDHNPQPARAPLTRGIHSAPGNPCPRRGGPADHPPNRGGASVGVLPGPSFVREPPTDPPPFVVKQGCSTGLTAVPAAGGHIVNPVPGTAGHRRTAGERRATIDAPSWCRRALPRFNVAVRAGRSTASLVPARGRPARPVSGRLLVRAAGTGGVARRRTGRPAPG